MIKIFKRIWFYFLSAMLFVIGKAIGKIHSPWTHKRTKYKDVLRLIGILEKGDIILDRTRGELTTAVIPGFWKHAMVYIGDGLVVEATGEGVHISYLADVIMHTDYYAGLRLNGFGKIIRDAVAVKAKKYVGKKYDFGMKLTSKDKMFCSEVVFDSINEIMGYEYIEHFDRMGFPSFTPDDCYNARKKFDLIIENK